MTQRPMLAATAITGGALAAVALLAVAAGRSVPVTPRAAGQQVPAANVQSAAPSPVSSVGASRPPAGSGSGRRVVYSLSRQHVWLLGRANELVADYQVAYAPRRTRLGRFKVYERALMLARGAEQAEYVVRFAYAGGEPVAFETVRGLRSGRDIQQHRADAKRLWEFAVVGTRIVVVA